MDKGQFHARIWAKLVAHNRTHRLLRRGDRILAAVSGGPDSVCLADFLRRLADRMPLDVRILHLHHGLRGKEADRDARRVERLGRNLGIPVIVRRLPVAEFAGRKRRSLEEAGRILRYKALAQEARRLGFNKVATGHQLDDVAETILLNLLRGTRAKGLAGIPPVRPLTRSRRDRILVTRPLLCLTRQEVLRYIRHRRLPYGQDRSNKSLRFTRNWVRRVVLPLLATRSPRIREHLNAIAQELRPKLDTP